MNTDKKKKYWKFTLVHDHDVWRVKKMVPYYKKDYLKYSQLYENFKK